MKGDPEERAVAVGQYLVRNGATVRAAARIFGVSKSTVWKDQTRLRHLNPGLWAEVRKVLQKNKAERHLRGARVYVTLFPCNECAKSIIQSGIKEIVYLSDKYHDADMSIASRKLLRMAGVSFRAYQPTGRQITFTV